MIGIKNFRLLDSITERFGEKQAKTGLTEFSGVWAYNPYLASEGQDTRAIQHYLGHKNIQHTVRYTALSPERFNDFWRD